MRAATFVLIAAAALRAQAQPPLRLTLAEARKLALQNNPEIAERRLLAAAAHQRPAQYRATYSPALSGSFTGVGADSGSRLASGGLNNPVVYNRIGSGLSVGQMVTDFGRTGSLVETARLHAEAQDASAESTRASVLLAASRAYFGLLRSRAVARVAVQTVAARRLVVDQVTALAHSQLKSTLDVSFAEVNLADAELLRAKAESDVRAAEAELAAAMGVPGESAIDVAEEPMPPPLPDVIASLISEALRNRPELQNLRLEQSAGERLVKAERALNYPTVGIAGSAGLVPTGEAAVTGRYGAIGLNVTIPILNGGLYKARQAEAELNARAARQRVRDLENRVVRDVRIAFQDAMTGFDRVGLTEKLLTQARSAEDLAQSRYDLGLSSIVELSQAQLNVTSAQIANASARYDYQSQRAALEFQIGALR